MAAKKKASRKKKTSKKATKKPVAKAAAPQKSGSWLTISEAAKMSGRSAAQFYNWKSSGKAPFVFHDVGGQTMIDAAEFKTWADANPKRKRRGRKPGRKAGVKAPAAAAAAPAKAVTGKFVFPCRTTEDLQNWVGLIGYLASKGVQVSFTVGGGKIQIG